MGNRAKNIFNSGEYAFVLVNGEKTILSVERGIKPMFDAVNNNLLVCNGACVADKVIGKAAAMLAAYGRIKSIYTPLITLSALEVCKAFNIEVEYENIVEYIKNRDKTGKCPMEQLAEGVDNPEEIFKRVKDFLE